MGEMEQAFFDECREGHKAITEATRDLGKLGYLIRSIGYDDGFLLIKCYCPQVNEGSKEANQLSMDGISDEFRG